MQDEHPDRQVRVPALAWLAIALLPEEVEQASRLARQALAEATGSARVVALLAVGRTAQARGDSASAHDLADQAVTHARHRRERRWLAEALELRASTVDGVTARAALREAQQIWLAAGAGHAVDRVPSNWIGSGRCQPRSGSMLASPWPGFAPLVCSIPGSPSKRCAS